MPKYTTNKPPRVTMDGLSQEIHQLRQALITSENIQREIRDIRLEQKQLAKDNIEHLTECAKKSDRVDKKLICLMRDSEAVKQDMVWIKSLSIGLFVGIMLLFAGLMVDKVI